MADIERPDWTARSSLREKGMTDIISPYMRYPREFFNRNSEEAVLNV